MYICIYIHVHIFIYIHIHEPHTNTHTDADADTQTLLKPPSERWGAGVETQQNVRGEVGGWGRVPFNEPYAPSLRTIYDGA